MDKRKHRCIILTHIGMITIIEIIVVIVIVHGIGILNIIMAIIILVHQFISFHDF